MNELNQGWGLAISWMVSVIVLITSIWLIVRAVKKQNNSK
jgi:hypothetical protein